MPCSYQQLTYEERCQIMALKERGDCPSRIANQLNRHRSTISRELKRNSHQYQYLSTQAERMAKGRRHRKATKMTPDLISLIETKLNIQWSPAQISGRLKLGGVHISHETIYKYLRRDKKNGGYLYKQLRHSGKKYNRRNKVSASRGCIPNRVDIDKRPAIVEEKSRVGDWELDTIIGAEHEGVIISMVDRHSKLTYLVKVPRKTAEIVQTGITNKLLSIKEFVHTLTADNGKEFAQHEQIARLLEADFFFAKPYHSWERGLNEHTNGLVRQYLPKGTKFSNCTQEQLDIIEALLNERPRKVLQFRTPQEVFCEWRLIHGIT